MVHCFSKVVYDSGVELYGNILTCSGSQEVIGSIPICSTQRIKGLQTSMFVALFSFAYSIAHTLYTCKRTSYINFIKHTTNILVTQLNL